MDELLQLEETFLTHAYISARQAGHIFPDMAACEAALESSYGRSALATDDNNLFGMKQHEHPVYGTAKLPTREWEHGTWVPQVASWVKYPDWANCFADRMATLRRLAMFRKSDGTLQYPAYDAALGARNSADYIIQVSRTWSTDPARAKKVIDIRLAHIGLFNSLTAAAATSA